MHTMTHAVVILQMAKTNLSFLMQFKSTVNGLKHACFARDAALVRPVAWTVILEIKSLVEVLFFQSTRSTAKTCGIKINLIYEASAKVANNEHWLLRRSENKKNSNALLLRTYIIHPTHALEK